MLIRVERFTDGVHFFHAVFFENRRELARDRVDAVAVRGFEFGHVLAGAVEVVDDREEVFEDFCGAVPGGLFSLVVDEFFVIGEVGERTSAGVGHFCESGLAFGELGAEEVGV